MIKTMDQPDLAQLIVPERSPPFIPADYVAPPEIRRISCSDVVSCLALGLADFKRTKVYGLSFAAVYVLGGIVILSALFAFGLEFLVFPVIAGFLLIGPFAAVGLYDISRRLQAGEAIALLPVALSFRRHGGKQLLLFGAVLVFIMIVWLKAAALTYALSFGLKPIQLADILGQASADPRILVFLAIGNFAGAVLAAIVFAISVVGIPCLLDRDIDFITAATTSLRAVRANIMPMALWCCILLALAAASVATGFLGFLVTLPVAGHATWHLYRLLVIQ